MPRSLAGEPSVVKTFNQVWIDWLGELGRLVRLLLQTRSSHIVVANAHLGRGATPPTQTIVGNFTGWAYTINDDSVITVELPHDVDDDQSIGIHFTFVINEAYATSSAEVQFRAAYSCIASSGETVSPPVTSGTLTTGDINIPAVAYTTYHSTSMSIPAADFSAGDIIGITFSRIALTGGTNPAAEPIVTNLHLEYKSKRTDWYGE